jgi:hypothetical protein
VPLGRDLASPALVSPFVSSVFRAGKQKHKESDTSKIICPGVIKLREKHPSTRVHIFNPSYRDTEIRRITVQDQPR